MKNRIFAAVFTLLASFALVNCEKENPCGLRGDCGEAQLADPANAENPFDQIGARHNEGLAHLRRQHQAEIDALTAAAPAEAERYIFGQSAGFAGSDAALAFQLRARLRLGDEQLLADFRFDDYEKWLQLAEIDGETRQALRESIADVASIEPGSVAAANAIIRAIQEQERRLLAQEGLPDRDFALVLLSIWRHSNHYWMQGDGGQPVPAKAKWWQTTLADAACGAVGFLLGGPAGGIGLGVGASKIVADYKD